MSFSVSLLASTYKWNHAALFFLWLISLNKCPLSSRMWLQMTNDSVQSWIGSGCDDIAHLINPFCYWFCAFVIGHHKYWSVAVSSVTWFPLESFLVVWFRRLFLWYFLMVILMYVCTKNFLFSASSPPFIVLTFLKLFFLYSSMNCIIQIVFT